MKNKLLCQKLIHDIHIEILNGPNEGEVAQYIPELAKVNPNQFGVCLMTTDGDTLGVGDCNQKFSIQSIVKVLSLSMAYKILGGTIWERVGVEPSGNPYNSLVQLETDAGIPRNPLINAGALVICDLLISHLDDVKSAFLEFIRQLCHSTQIDYSHDIAQSEKSVGYRNIALCNFIKSFGNIENEPEEVLDFYFKMCSIEMSCSELARTFMYLANDEYRSSNSKRILNVKEAQRINAIMQTCGFYDESGEFAFRVGLPGKSGVGGGIIAVNPDNYTLAVWSPRLNAKGNSYRGMKFLEEFTSRSETSIF